ncbi:4Fe-4S dicluster domain-containing protein [Telmatobacter bradus]|uniref:4Fe-4S dicluster domain-containing protein n=1 Tax=Telmatobacter bradus TaxID=474953 RepID=UPI003B4314AB
MTNPEKKDRGKLAIDENECKGCTLCVAACPPHVIALQEHLNHYGYRTAQYAGAGCTACGICFMVCPEPGAITVFKLNAGARQNTTQNTTLSGQGAAACASN